MQSMEKGSNRRLLTLSQAAEMLGRSVSTVKRLIASRDLETVRIGEKGWRKIKLSSLSRLLKAVNRNHSEKRKARHSGITIIVEIRLSR
jgi:excisionase family DNA binding protein